MALRFQVGVISMAFSTDPREAAQRAREGGFAGVQFDAFAGGLNLKELTQSGRREFRHILASQEQQLTSLRIDLGVKGLSPGSDIDRAIARVEQAMEAAAGLAPHAPLLCVEFGPLPEPARAASPRLRITPEQAGIILIPTAVAASQPEEPARPADAAFESHVDAALKEIGRRADRYSVIVAFRSELASFAALERALRAASCPWFGVDLDPAGILRDHWSIGDVFDHIGPLIRHVRGRDAVVGHDRRTRPAAIGNGSTNWGELLALLDESGYHGWITVDPLELPDRAAGAVNGRVALERAGRA